MQTNLRLAIWYLTVTPVLDFILLSKNAKKPKTWFEHIFWYNYAYLMQKWDMLHSKISKHTVITQKSYFSWAVTALVALFKWIIFQRKHLWQLLENKTAFVFCQNVPEKKNISVKKRGTQREIFSLFFSQLFNEKLTEPDRKKENLTASYKQVMGSNPSCPSA